MSEIYTANDLIRYIYEETSAEENVHIQHLIQHNLKAAEEFKELLSTIGSLEQVSLNAHPTSIQLILEHSHHQAELI
ncbi:MAG: hypothetical protein V4651_05750 [Bacteroidota bacterium]